MTRLEHITKAALLTQQAIEAIDRHWLGSDYTGADIRGAHGALEAAKRLLTAAMARESRGGAKPEQD